MDEVFDSRHDPKQYGLPALSFQYGTGQVA